MSSGPGGSEGQFRDTIREEVNTDSMIQTIQKNFDESKS